MLTGKLTRLRPCELADRDRVLRWINDPEVTHWLAARYPYSSAAEDAWLHRAMTLPSGEGVVLAIETLAESRHIGTINLEAVLPVQRSAELGIVIGEKDCWGKGFGSDAIITLLRFAFDDLNLHRVLLTVLTENPRAIASYRKCGFVHEGVYRQHYFQEGRYWDIAVMGVLDEDFWGLHGRGLERSA